MVFNDSEFLMISGLQHFSFCRRQWALIHIENVWADNYLTALGNAVHERVHNESLREVRGDDITVRAMAIKSERLGICGECDAVVFSRSADGITLGGREGKWSVLPVEYKRGRQKSDDCDRLQVTAQTMCLEEMLCCRIERAAVFYGETRRREFFDVTSELRKEVEKEISQMRDLLRRAHVPKVRPTAKCRSCSLYDICLPHLMRSKKSVSEYVGSYLTEEDE